MNGLYQQYASSIFRYAYFKVSDYEIASDLTADTFIRFWKVLKKEKIVKPKAFLFAIVNGFIIDYYRKRKNQKKIGLDVIDERLLGFTDRNEEAFARKQEIEIVYANLGKIKKEYQDVLLFYYVEELTIKEISYIMNKNENNIRVLIHRALRALKKLL